MQALKYYTSLQALAFSSVLRYYSWLDLKKEDGINMFTSLISDIPCKPYW